MYGQNFQETNDSDQTGREEYVSDYIREHYPNVALVLGGAHGSKKEKRQAIPPATLLLFCRDGGLGFVICPKDYPQNGHGFIEEPAEILSQLEDQIEKSRIGWKPSRKK